ncbi:hypothetical protein FLP41_07845 [Paracoccus marcusii]|nr:hypothetical protein FLP41_07845 [Paracoccus marcusii]
MTRSDVPSPKPAPTSICWRPGGWDRACPLPGLRGQRCRRHRRTRGRDDGRAGARHGALSGENADFLATDLIAGARGIGLLAA